jgi:hypothetical protein
MSTGIISQLQDSATMLLRHLITPAVVSIVLASCATAPPVSSAPQPSSEQAVTVYPTIKRWTGTFSPKRSYNAAAVASQRQNAYGNVELTVSPSSPTLTHVTLKVTLPNEPGLDLAGWGLSEGRCGSGNPPVLAPSMFPAVQLRSSGQGNIDAKIPFIIPETGSYHVNVFRRSGTQLTDVITCADLRRGDS